MSPEAAPGATGMFAVPDPATEPAGLASRVSPNGIVLNIQRFSVHDGPGIRTTVFLKGCPLVCAWCNNPESQESQPQIVFWAERCIECNACVAACQRDAVEVGAASDGGMPAPGPPSRRVLVERCDLCGGCLDACYSGALERVGRSMTADEVVGAAVEDRLFFDESGGGVTLSGGEPTAQPGFSHAVLEGCRRAGIHTAIESAGMAPWRVWASLLPHLELVLLDLKEIDDARHRTITGVSNRLILENARRLASLGIPLIVRRPHIPGYNDSPESLHALGRFVRELGTVREVDLLPFNRFGSAKYGRLDREYPLGDRPSLTTVEAEPARALLASYGLHVKIGG